LDRGSDTLIRALPIALEVPADVVQRAVEATQRQLLEAEETAIVLTERERPEPMFVAANTIVSKLNYQLYRSGKNPGSIKIKCHAWREAYKQARWDPTLPSINFRISSARLSGADDRETA
jgi:hypothetical protein